jgi:hypothetical protein
MRGKCTCGKEAHSKSNNIGEFIKETQFGVSFSANGNIATICPECCVKVEKLANELLKLVGNEFVYLNSLTGINTKRLKFIKQGETHDI